MYDADVSLILPACLFVLCFLSIDLVFVFLLFLIRSKKAFLKSVTIFDIEERFLNKKWFLVFFILIRLVFIWMLIDVYNYFSDGFNLVMFVLCLFVAFLVWGVASTIRNSTNLDL